MHHVYIRIEREDFDNYEFVKKVPKRSFSKALSM